MKRILSQREIELFSELGQARWNARRWKYAAVAAWVTLALTIVSFVILTALTC